MLFVIEGVGPGRLATMARPPSGDALPAAMTALADEGVAVLVSALGAEEAGQLNLADEPAAAARAGLEFINFPIVDGDVPEPSTRTAAYDLSGRLAEHIRGGRFVVTHCLAGIGRSSLLAGAILVRLGLSPAEAWRRIRAARGLPVPDNPRQERWLHSFATEPPPGRPLGRPLAGRSGSVGAPPATGL